MTQPLQPSHATGCTCQSEEAARLSEDEAIPEHTGDLIAFILDRYHNVHRRELPQLIALARHVESVHSGHPEAPRGLAELLEDIAENMEMHMQKEEQVLFPMLAAGGNPMVVHPIAMMRAEHDDHAANLTALSRLTHGFQPAAGACDSWRSLYAGAAKLSADLTEHMRIENDILFPRFGA